MRYLFAYLFIVSSLLFVNGQSANTLYEKNFKQGEEILEANVEQVDLALFYFLTANKHLVGPKKELYYKIGLCYLLKNSAEGIPYLKAIDKPFFSSPKILPYLIARSHQIAGDYEEARDYYWQFIRKVGKRAIVKGLEIDPITAYLIEGDRYVLSKKSFKMQSLLDDIFCKISSCELGINLRDQECAYGTIDSQVAFNTIYDESNAIRDEKRKWMILSRKIKDLSVSDVNSANRYNEDVVLDATQEQSFPSLESINSIEDERILQYDQENEVLYFKRFLEETKDDIFKSYLINDSTWSKPYRLTIPINSDANESSIFVFDDGRKAFFTSDRDAGRGRLDIFYVEMDEEGNWTAPYNLGDSVNTAFDEEGVFYDTIERKLFFSSMGHQSLGGFDIFESNFDVSTRNSSKARNLGYPVNTSNDEQFFKYVNAYQDALFVSNRPGGKGGFDCYLAILKNRKSEERNMHQIIVEEDDTGLTVTVSPDYIGEAVYRDSRLYISTKTNLSEKNSNPKIYLDGTIIDEKISTPITAKIILRKENGTILDEILSNDDGRFKVSINATGKIVLELTAQGYYPKKHSVEVSQEDFGEGHELSLVMTPDVRDIKPFDFKNLYFEEGRWGIEGDNKDNLDQLIAYLKRYPSMRMKIYGHADLNEAGTNTKRISANRSWGVKQYIIKNGVNKDRLISFGYGDEKPVSSGRSEGERLLNRRVSFKMLEQ